MSDYDDDLKFPLEIPVSCMACGEYVGVVTGYRQAADLSASHDVTCTASDDEKQQAVFNMKFAMIAADLTREGFPCQ